MNISLIITTYNWPEALNAVLISVSKQTILPAEVIIADDGSGKDTADLIKNWQANYPVPLIHSWQEDNGFRLAENRNKAIAQAKSEYIVIIDGDMVLEKHFIQDYMDAARPGWFIQGGRVITNPKSSSLILDKKQQLNFFSPDLGNRKNAIRSKTLSKIFSQKRNNTNSVRGCNMGFWKQDLIKVNGFNNDFVGWGREDSEIVIRLLNAGLNRLYLKFAAVAYHLYHHEIDRGSLPENDILLNNTINNQLTRCENGLNKFNQYE